MSIEAQKIIVLLVLAGVSAAINLRAAGAFVSWLTLLVCVGALIGAAALAGMWVIA